MNRFLESVERLEQELRRDLDYHENELLRANIFSTTLDATTKLPNAIIASEKNAPDPNCREH
ncbi:MAG: hypothetical protein O6951_06655 [Actinobacteria bacterium]|nr:hypothetical protein [Actinomycetota bacterium]